MTVPKCFPKCVPKCVPPKGTGPRDALEDAGASRFREALGSTGKHSRKPPTCAFSSKQQPTTSSRPSLRPPPKKGEPFTRTSHDPLRRRAHG
jgi:hypothetical protein